MADANLCKPTLATYFPKNSGHTTIVRQDLPERSTTVKPPYDAQHSGEPIPVFDERRNAAIYRGASETGEAIQPPPPDCPNPGFLVPSLARNERLRLTLLWYHAPDLEHDAQLLAKIDTLVKGAQKVIGWDYAAAGTLSESRFTPLATSQLPLTLLLRRETTCAHTINQAPGTVFMLPDMAKDWRFRNSPHVATGCIRGYAGTQLCLTADDGAEVAIGTLCVASVAPQPPLSPDKQEFLVRFAELISATIASHTRQRRLKAREQMGALVSALEDRITLPAQDCAATAVDIVREAYPGAQVSLSVAAENKVTVEGRASIPLSDVHEGIWEDTEFIEQRINAFNYEELHSEHPVRALVAHCGSSDKYIIVASCDIHHVFDDFDARFVLRCASIVQDAIRNQLLKQAVEARETFMLGITHQLRTPIHGILGSVELLEEDLAGRQLLDGSPANDSSSTSAYLATIKKSGQELRATINNVLKHNTWAAGLWKCQPSLGPYDLRNLERDVLPCVLLLLPLDQLAGTSIRFHYDLPAECVLTTDARLLQDCLRAIILNATQSVLGEPSGTVSVTVRSNPDHSTLWVDIVDDGCGIELADHDRIFGPYEKVDSHTLGAGLGLTLASTFAQSLNGSVRLVSSAPGSGSCFRLELNDVHLASPASTLSRSRRPSPTTYLPHTFTDIRTGPTAGQFVDHTVAYLVEKGFRQSDDPDVGLVVTNARPEKISSWIRPAHPNSVIIRCGPADHTSDLPFGTTLSGPLHSQKLDQTLQHAESLYKASILSTTAERCKNPVADLPSPPPSDAASIDSSFIQGVADIDLDESETNETPPCCQDVPLRALLVDDNLINLRILQMFCQKREIPYVTATDGNKALTNYAEAAASGSPITLVLMDLQMPHCDGVQATAKIRAYETEHVLARACVFMVTGQDAESVRALCAEAGADEFLVKPVGPTELDRHIGGCFPAYQFSE